jgi:hypothetical protein
LIETLSFVFGETVTPPHIIGIPSIVTSVLI